MADNIISSLGAGSGIDIKTLVTQLTAVERAPKEQRLDARKESLEAQISGYGQLRSAFDTFKGSLTPLSNGDLFNARSATVPNSDVITANRVEPGAQTGSYSIEVQEVARAQTLAIGGAAQTDPKAALGASGSMTVRFGAWTDADGNPQAFAANDDRTALTLNISNTDSLEDIASKINAADSGMQAAVIKVNDQYQLTLTADSGRNNAMEISTSGTNLEAFSFKDGALNANQTQAAQDAQLKINGLAVTRESNEIDDLIEGFSFTVNKKGTAGESLNFSITADKTAADQAIRDFVEAYNSFQKTTQELVGYTRDEDDNLVRGGLAGDSTARTMINRMREQIGGILPGAQGGFTALTNLGIRTERDGSLTINETDFKNAFDNNFDLLEGLFASKMSSTNSAVEVKAGTFASRAVAGTYDVEITQDPTRGQIAGNALTHDFSAPLDTSDPAADYSFNINVDGTNSGLIKLTGTYANADELRADLQARINGDSNLRAAGVAVDVEYDTGTNQFNFVSREYGSISKVSFTSASTQMAELGIETALTGTQGLDVKGTINGVEGFGAGNVLLPDVDSPAYGLNLTVGAGATAQGKFQISFSRGVAGELANMIDNFVGSTGSIKTRESSIQKQLDGIKEERSALDRRMEGFQARLMSQFMAMENIVSSLKDTGSQLDGINDRLPFTASN
ncbi:flagellar filament capping protein FliD [Allochromatium vinosum]|uniref:Flagellar hook-associated protein 2 n=1 Tax=Allochromatium vinosum (strain ATCC 17899 / DSM 180 / NBRC 103801 / NCIMB 10441 / D) TaxID=572477 RepID=D3RUL8_ALLVD|nr:flagellar filament capping protein FliD [Allochromatium vinosum]ADC62877.1 flagellar hook-associated 2 domain protein [Allochromatium vinosum DSM 180]